MAEATMPGEAAVMKVCANGAVATRSHSAATSSVSRYVTSPMAAGAAMRLTLMRWNRGNASSTKSGWSTRSRMNGRWLVLPNPVMRCWTYVKKLSRACSPSLPMSTPASTCAAMLAAVASATARPNSSGSTGSLRLRRPWSSASSLGRGRLTACVVRIRDSLVSMSSRLLGQERGRLAGCPITVEEPERDVVAVEPLVVVDRGPMEEPGHLDAVVDRFRGLVQAGAQVHLPGRVVGGAEAALRDEKGTVGVLVGEPVQHHAETVRPRRVPERTDRRVRRPRLEVSVAADAQRVVVREADEVEGLDELGVAPGRPDRVVDPRRLLAGLRGAVGNVDRRQVLDRRDGRTTAAQEPGRVTVGAVDRAQRQAEVAAIATPRRDAAGEEPGHRVAHGLVDRLPSEDQVTERLGTEVDVPWPPIPSRLLVAEAAEVVAEPAGQREVMEAHPRRHARVACRDQHGAVVLDGVVVAAALLRFDAGPLDRQTVVRQAVLGEKREVLGVARGKAVAFTGGGCPPEALPTRPIRCGRRPLTLG